MNSQQEHHNRKEARWQFRRNLLLACARRIQENPEVWDAYIQTQAAVSAQGSASTKRCVRRWQRFTGGTREGTLQAIHRYFQEDTPEGRRREKLQDLTNCHCFSGILTPAEIHLIRLKSNAEAGLPH